MGYVRELTITGLMDEKPMMVWAAHYLSAMAKALMNDAELGDEAVRGFFQNRLVQNKVGGTLRGRTLQKKRGHARGKNQI